jgi:hypothetical protein
MDPTDSQRPWTRDTVSDSAILGGSSSYFLRARSFFSFDLLDKWNINIQGSISCVRQAHVMVFLIVFSVDVLPGWSKYIWHQNSTLFCLSQWLRNVDLIFFLCNKVNHTLQYALLSDEVGISPFLLIPWLMFLVGSLKIKAVWIVNSILLLLLLPDPERSVSASSSWIFRFSMTRRDKTSATTFFFGGIYSNVTP